MSTYRELIEGTARNLTESIDGLRKDTARHHVEIMEHLDRGRERMTKAEARITALEAAPAPCQRNESGRLVRAATCPNRRQEPQPPGLDAASPNGWGRFGSWAYNHKTALIALLTAALALGAGAATILRDLMAENRPPTSRPAAAQR